VLVFGQYGPSIDALEKAMNYNNHNPKKAIVLSDDETEQDADHDET
jgi:hypothetical protein